MLRPFRAGDGAFEKGLKGSDIPARAEGPGKIPAKRNLSPEGAEHKLVCAWLMIYSPRIDIQKQICPAPTGLGNCVALSFPGPSAQAGMLRPFRAGDGAFEKGLKGSDIPARAEGLGKIPAKRNISPEGAEHKLTFHEEVGFALFCRCIRVVLWRRTEK